jgi:predicted dehydrogenase
MSTIALLAELVSSDLSSAVDDLHAYLARCGLATRRWPDGADVVMVWADRPPSEEITAALQARAAAGVPVLLCGPTATAYADVAGLVEAAGIVPGTVTPEHEIRLRPGADSAAVTARIDGDVIVTDRWLAVDKVRDDVQVLAAAMAGLGEHAVMTWRPGTGVGVLSVGSRPATLADPRYRRLVHRWLRHVLGVADGRPVRVGVLGYGAIGHEHNEAIAAVDGLVLAGVCDKNPARVDAARSLAPEVTAYADGADLVASDDIDLVVVSTPPSSHAAWALRALQQGKHVVVEKPFCLTTAEADSMLAAARESGRVLAVYQNRRWDADYLTLKRLVQSGAIGDVFHYESFVGSFAHPCNYWHSDEDVSGGAIYDWGSHYLDWVLDLFPQPVEHVTGAVHKRVWHDVTNADHSRVTVRFADGLEADFVHSDLAAAMKPKWYVLGTAGAVVGSWRSERVVSRSSVGNLVEDPLAASESPAVLTLHAPDGSVTSVATPPAPRQPFHRELAERILSGAPMSVTPEGSRRNIAVMEAATISARDGGRPVRPQ